MLKNNFSLSIFFPAYNEEALIASSVEKAITVAQTLTDTFEVIVVNDGSRDRTGDIVDEIAARDPRVRVVHQENKGYGAAVWAGIQAARYEYTFFTDADLQFDLDELALLCHYIPRHEVILGYRAERQDPFIRLLNAWGWNLLNRTVFGLKVKDVDCAFKLFKTNLVKNLPIKSRGAMMSAEMLIRLQRKGVVFKEIPVTHLPRTAGEATGAKPAVILRAFKELFSLYRGDLGRETQATGIEVITFGIIGVVNTLIDLVTYFLLTRTTAFFATYFLLAKALSFILGTVFSFFMNRVYIFRFTHKTSLKELVKFYSTVGLGVFINTLCVYIFHSVFGFYDLAAVAIATVITFVWNFIFSKFWVFRREDQEKISPEYGEPKLTGTTI